MRKIFGILAFIGISAFAEQIKITELSNWKGANGGMQVDITNDSLALVTSTWSGLDIINIANPQKMALISSINPAVSYGASRALPINKSVVLVAARGGAGVYSVNISDLKKPYTAYSYPKISVNDLEIRDSIAFLPITSKGLGIYKVDSTGKLDSIAFLALPGENWAVTVSDTIAAVSSGSSGLHFVSIKDITKPRLLSSKPLSGNDNAFQSAWDSSYLWTVHNSGNITLYDVKNPNAIRLVNSYKSSISTYRISNASKNIFITTSKGILSFQKRDSTLTPIGSWNSSTANPWIHGVTANDSVIFALDHNNSGLTAASWKIIKPAQPISPLGSIRTNTPNFLWNRGTIDTSFTLNLANNVKMTSPILTLSISDTSITLPMKLQPGKWWWTITGGTTLQIKQGSFTIYADSVPLPKTINGAIITDSSSILRWNVAKPSASYKVQLSPVVDFTAPMTFTTNDTTFAVPSQLSEGLWYWRAGTGNEFGPIDSFRVTAPVSVKSASHITPLIKFDGNSYMIHSENAIRIYSTSGNLLSRKHPHKGIAQVKKSELPIGVLIIKTANFSGKILNK